MLVADFDIIFLFLYFSSQIFRKTSYLIHAYLEVCHFISKCLEISLLPFCYCFPV